MKSDFQDLNTTNLNQYFSSISEVKLTPTDEISSVWAYFVKPPVQVTTNGQYKLDLLFISQNDEDLKAIVQYQIVDQKTGDTVEEFARYYDLETHL